MVTSKQQKLLQKASRDIRDFARNERRLEKRRSDFTSMVGRYLRSPKEGLNATPEALEAIGCDPIAVGQYRVLQNDLAGWRFLDEGLAWNHLAYCIRAARLLSAPEYVAYAHSLGEDRVADDIASRLTAHYAGRPEEAMWHHYRFAAFVFQLRLRWRDLPADPEIVLKPGPLSELLEHVYDQDITRELLAVCDWHLVEATSGDDAELFTYELYPMEILWVQRIRAERGLPNSELDHPLMKTPLAQPPPPDQRPRWDRQDPLYQEVRQRMIKENMLPVDAP